MELLASKQEEGNVQVTSVRGYYKWHAQIYQATRWTFLFGRKRILKALNRPLSNAQVIVEVGCGTGHNLHYLAKHYPNLRLLGIDISPDMLSVATKKLKRFLYRISLLEQPYAPGDWALPAKPDVILFSYCLTMINPGWEAALQRAADDLDAGGMIAVVDFHGSVSSLFRRWMGYNHVRMEEHLLPVLEKQFHPIHSEVRRAYGGLWSYFLFVGRK